MRRSSSRQRGSLLSERSIAPPVLQKLCQCFARRAAAIESKSGTSLAVGLSGVNRSASSSESLPLADVSTKSCRATSSSLPPVRPAGGDFVLVVVERAGERARCRRGVRQLRFDATRGGPNRRSSPRRCRREISVRSRSGPWRPAATTRARRADLASDGRRFRLRPAGRRSEMAHQHAVPEPQRLVDFRQIVGLGRRAVGLREPEAELAQVEAVGIGPQPGDFRRADVARDVGVADLAAVGVELAEVELFDRPAVGIREPSASPNARACRAGSFRRMLRETSAGRSRRP